MPRKVTAVSLALFAATLAACAQQSAPHEHAIAFASTQPGTDGVFGEWVSQIIRTPAKAVGGNPTYENAAVYDEAFKEARPMLALTLADDGTYSLLSNYSAGSRSIAFGTWSMTGSKIALEQNGDVAWVFISLGGKLVAEKSDGPTIILGRK